MVRKYTKGKNMLNDYQNYIALSRYARWREEEGRRETFPETVDRYISFFLDRNYPAGKLAGEDYNFIDTTVRSYIEELKAMPSMRCLMTAGVALDRDNVAAFNCSYNKCDDITFFDQAMYILMCGTGFGFSVERQDISHLPEIKSDDENLSILKELLAESDPELLPLIQSNPELRELYNDLNNFPNVPTDDISYFDNVNNTIRVTDSKIGWASAYRILIVELYNQNFDIKWDVSGVRPAGSRLKTFGGRASGPEPLVSLFNFTLEQFKNAKGRKLTSIECHDLMCKIAEIVVVGGVRRSALISLSNLTDDRMRRAKMGQWWVDEKQRALANNSVCYTERPDMGAFMEEWMALYQSKSGERGIFSRVASETQVINAGNFREEMMNRPEFAGLDIPRRDYRQPFGTNPCSEIILRPKQFCNLSEVVVRRNDTLEDLKEKVRIATILGTLQSSLSHFRYLDDTWQKNTEEECLLGVSLTGIMDHPIMAGQKVDKETMKAFTGGKVLKLSSILKILRAEAIATNAEWAPKIGVNKSRSITCVKPSGTVSQLVDSASGMHDRYASFYIRTVRADNKDPMTQFMKDQGIPHEPDMTKPDSTTVFTFYQKSPEGAIMRTDRTALEQLDMWMTYQTFWCEHKPSITVYVKEHEWMEVGTWVWQNFDKVSGVSFLPFSEHSYAQAPYQDIDEATYRAGVKAFPKIDWKTLQDYEKEDNTEGTQTLACTGGVCELM